MEKTVCLCNIYAPNCDDPDFFKRVLNMIEGIDDSDMLILGGDFNSVLNTELDHHKSDYNHINSQAVVEEIMNQKKLV